MVYGGVGLSEEAEISQRSGKAVMEAARAAGFGVAGFELARDNIDAMKRQASGVDVVFPALHGVFGEDGQIQQILDDAGVKYVGCDVMASQVCFDKNVHKTRLSEAKILTPSWWILDKTNPPQAFDFPVVIKPVTGGSSVDTLVVKTANELDKNEISRLLDKYGKLMVEEYIQGQEIAVGVLGGRALPVVEIIPKGEWFDLEAKYSDETEENIPPKYIDETIQKDAQELALRIHRLTGCKDISRTDMIIRDGKIYVLETNTMPGMTPQSLYPKEAQAAGYDMSALVRELIEAHA